MQSIRCLIHLERRIVQMLPIVIPLGGTDIIPAALLRMLTAKLTLRTLNTVAPWFRNNVRHEEFSTGKSTQVFQLWSNPKSDCDCDGLLKDWREEFSTGRYSNYGAIQSQTVIVMESSKTKLKFNCSPGLDCSVSFHNVSYYVASGCSIGRRNSKVILNSVR